jgi:hypothetical protein
MFKFFNVVFKIQGFVLQFLASFFIQFRAFLFMAYQCESHINISGRAAFTGGLEPALGSLAYALFIL